MTLFKITAVNNGDTVTFNKEKVESDWNFDDYSGIVAVDGHYFENEKLYLDAKAGVGTKFVVGFNETETDGARPLNWDEGIQILDEIVEAAHKESEFYKAVLLSWQLLKRSFKEGQISI